MGETQTVTFNRITNGQFEVLLNGQGTVYSIHNGNLGVSGMGNNVYGIRNATTDKVRWVGSLQKSKKTVTQWLTKGAGQ